ncbi:MAG: CoA transferase [Desulfobacteraceae bacterium]|nr:MAG: CoA transferase [Desulfobacteraceae bacterium]
MVEMSEHKTTTSTEALLRGFRVLDLTTDPTGPYAAQNLAGLGAEVIKIERPHIGDPCRWNPPFVGPKGIAYEVKNPYDISVQYLRRNRGKKSVFLNLRHEMGRELFKRLVKVSDVVIENFAPGIMEANDLDYDRLKQVNPGIVFCSVSGYGQDSAYKESPGFDLMVQAASGIMEMEGSLNRSSIRCGTWAGQMVPALWATISIMAALLSREKTGRGDYIDISMQDACFSAAADEFLKTSSFQRTLLGEDESPSRPAPWNVYPTRSGQIVICVAQSSQWYAFLEVIGREDLRDDPRFKSQQMRSRNADAIDAITAAWLESLTADEAVNRLREKKIPCERVSSFERAMADPRLISRRMIQEAMHPVYGKTGLKASGFPAKFWKGKAGFFSPAPYPGQHNEEIYMGLLGLSKEYMERLKEEEII